MKLMQGNIVTAAVMAMRRTVARVVEETNEDRFTLGYDEQNVH